MFYANIASFETVHYSLIYQHKLTTRKLFVDNKSFSFYVELLRQKMQRCFEHIAKLNKIAHFNRAQITCSYVQTYSKENFNYTLLFDENMKTILLLNIHCKFHLFS